VKGITLSETMSPKGQCSLLSTCEQAAKFTSIKIGTPQGIPCGGVSWHPSAARQDDGPVMSGCPIQHYAATNWVCTSVSDVWA